jgi:predicted  nucleic acid-binding Zn-ribbon protein
MQDELERLRDLQNIDYDLGELERSKEYIPDMMDNLASEIREAEQTLITTQETLTEARREQKDVELQLAQKQESLKKYQQQMLTIKTNREYDALVTEIDKVKEGIRELENRELELMELIERTEKELEGMDDKVAEIKKTNQEQLSSLQDKIDSVGGLIQSRVAERERMLQQINKRIVTIYERVRKGKGGDVVVPVRKRACGACFKALPPQKIQEIKLGREIITCDSCGRLLIWTDESNGN